MCWEGGPKWGDVYARMRACACACACVCVCVCVCVFTVWGGGGGLSPPFLNPKSAPVIIIILFLMPIGSISTAHCERNLDTITPISYTFPFPSIEC